MVFKPKNRDRITDCFPSFTLDGCALAFVSQFKYLGHIINNTLNDDDNIKREIKNLFMRTNMLINRHRKCSINVKLTLFKTFCMSMYDLCLWKHYSVTVLNKFRSCYNKCIKKFFGYSRRQSMYGILILLFLPTADTILHNSRIVFQQHCVSSCNKI